MFLAKLISKERRYFSIGKDYTRSISLVIHSDTLFSAICNNFRKIYGNGKLEEFLEILKKSEEKNESILELSSCFHYFDVYKQGEFLKTIYFLPKPLITFPFDDLSQEIVDENFKLFKKIKFISLEVARKLQNNEKISFNQFLNMVCCYLLDREDLKIMGLSEFLTLLEKINLNHEKIWRAINNRISIFEIMEEQKVGISRGTNESEPFIWPKMKFNKSIYFIRNGEERINYEIIPGFYFLFNCSNLNEELRNEIYSSIKLIMDEGLGGKKSLGCGLFDDVEMIELDENNQYYKLLSENSLEYFINLSLVYPNKEDLENIEYFNIFERSGYIFSADTNSLRFNDLKLIEEGGIFNKKVRGKLVQVATDDFIKKYHKVYKNGIGMYLNISKIGVE